MSLFDRYTTIETMRSGQLALAAMTYPQLSAVTDELLWQTLQEAIQEVSRRLGLSLEPLEIFTEPPTEQELIDLGDTPYCLEPGYALTPQFFTPEHWGFLSVSHKPIIAVHHITLVLPSLSMQPVPIPLAWLSINHKYGQITIVPTAAAGGSTLALFMARFGSFGVSMPNALRVRYRAGLDCSSGGYADVLGCVQRMAIMRLLQNAMLPQASTISVDGLSQSITVSIEAMQKQLNDRLDNLKQQLTGLLMESL
ncbi:MAG: hypothetical protein D4R63_11350 [Methylococcaceae bacterium]|nr:MAG: hypothetical protein D4R63_11350 [Methylococcaceae bacterium]